MALPYINALKSPGSRRSCVADYLRLLWCRESGGPRRQPLSLPNAPALQFSGFVMEIYHLSRITVCSSSWEN